jgi:hypothetical protein
MKQLLTALALSSIIIPTAHAQRHQSDREFYGLKGTVKLLVAETATLRHEGVRDLEGPRVTGWRVTFDATGNMLNSELYDDDGRPVQKAAYRYVGGVKVAEGQVVAPIITIDPALLPSKPGDAQLAQLPAMPPNTMMPMSQKFRYKYDARGNVREWVIEERGEVTQRIVYTLKANRKETRWYDGGGQSIGRQVERLDARGNPVETTEYGFVDEKTEGVMLKTSYTAYEFDAQGNWVKRLTTESGSDEPEVRKVEHRTITYF